MKVDPTAKGVRVAEAIKGVADEAMLYGRAALLINRVGDPQAAERLAAETPLEVIGLLPEDPAIRDFDAQGRSLLELPDSSPALTALQEIIRRLE